MAIEAYVEGSPVIIAGVSDPELPSAQNSGATYIKGDPGPPGPEGPEGPAGQDGQDGQDGFSPTVTPSVITGGHRLTIVDVDGTSTVDVMDGVDGQDGTDGQDGADGADGVSPTVSSEAITGGHRLTITDAQGTTTFDVMDGQDGQGSPGTATPLMDGTAAVGTATAFSREDHVHPSDTGKVSVTGDTMTGGLEIDGNDLNIENTAWAVTETPTSNSYRFVNFNDKNGTTFAQIAGSQFANGTVGLRFAARRTVGGSETITNFTLLVDQNGQSVVSINHPESWLSALGLGTSGALPITIDQGGTGATNAETAVANLGLGTLRAEKINITNGSSGEFSVPNSSRGLLISSGANNATKDMFLYNVTSGGAVTYVQMGTSTGITITTATNKITIANSGGSATQVCKISY